MCEGICTNAPFSRHLLAGNSSEPCHRSPRCEGSSKTSELASDCKHDSNLCTVSTNFELHYYHTLVGVVCGTCKPPFPNSMLLVPSWIHQNLQRPPSNGRLIELFLHVKDKPNVSAIPTFEHIFSSLCMTAILSTRHIKQLIVFFKLVVQGFWKWMVSLVQATHYTSI